jgi:MipA family protein
MRALTLLFCLFSAAPSLAQQPDTGPPPSQPDRDSITIGLGGGIGPSYEGSDNYRFQPGGVVQGKVSGFAFAMRGLNLYVDLAREAPDAKIDIVAGPVAQLQTNRSGGVRDARVKALGKIPTTVELGGYAGIGVRQIANRFDSLSVDVTVLQDVGGVHKGLRVSPAIGYFSPIGRKGFGQVGLSADYSAGGYRSTYFDVSAAGSAASGLAPFRTSKAGFDKASVTVLLGRSLGPNPRKGWSLFALGGVSRLLGDVAQSPIVRDAGSRNQAFGVAGVAYSF